jgi:hypothetical protein
MVKGKLTAGILILLFSVSFVYAIGSFGNRGSAEFSGSYQSIGGAGSPQYSNPGFFSSSSFTSPGTYWDDFNQENCYNRQDFILQIAPGGCSPAVVRSDLLEERNVPVFCKVMSVKINPLIDVSRVRSMRFINNLPEGVSSITYYPARAAIRSQSSLISSPVEDNMGYVVIVLSQNEIEDDMPDFVEGNITALIDYDSEGAYGIGQGSFYLFEMQDNEWNRDYEDSSFWNGRGYVRAENIESDRATIGLYGDIDTKQSSVTLKKGETSEVVYMGGFYCGAGVRIRLDSIDAPVPTALIKVNGEQKWVSRNDKIIDEKCIVKNIDSHGIGGKVDISCPVRNGRFDLELIPGSVSLEVDDAIRLTEKEDQNTANYHITEQVAFYESKDDPLIGKYAWLVYVGKFNAEKFSVLAKLDSSYRKDSIVEKDLYTKINQIIVNNEKGGEWKDVQKEILKELKNAFNIQEDSVFGILSENEPTSTDFNGIKLAQAYVLTNREFLSDEDTQKNLYEKAVGNYTDLFDFYSDELSPTNNENYASLGLYEAAQLAKSYNMNEDAYDFYSLIINNYPNTPLANTASRERDLMTQFDSTKTKALVYVNNQEYFVELLDFKTPTKEDANAEFSIGGRAEKLGLGETFPIKVTVSKTSSDGKTETSVSETAYIQLKELKQEYITLEYPVEVNGNLQYKTKSLDLHDDKNNQFLIGKTNVRLLKINLNEQAKITLLPEVAGTRTNSTFKFKIGIEKRAIELSPEQTLNMIKRLNEQIDRWAEINNKLGKVVKVMKAGCFATSAMLTVKNFFSGMGGKSMARNEVMTASNGWNDFCEGEASLGKYGGSPEKCLLENNAKIEEDVNLYAEQITQINDELESIQDNHPVDGSDLLDFQGEVDAKAVENDFKEYYSDNCNGGNGNYELNDGRQTPINIREACSWGSFSQQKDIIRDKQILDNSKEGTVIHNMAKQRLQNTLTAAKVTYDEETLRKDNEPKLDNLGLSQTNLPGDSVTYSRIKILSDSDLSGGYSGFDNYIGENDKPTKLAAGDKVMTVFIPPTYFNGDEYVTNTGFKDGDYAVIKLEDDGKGDYSVGTVYTSKGETSDAIHREAVDYLTHKGATKFRETNEVAYENQMVNKQNLQVKYFEREPYKGMPSFVPFDSRRGWYVQLTYVLSGFGRPYDESGRAVNYYICNVGKNGIPEFKKQGDDICRYYNGNTADLSFPGMNLDDSRKLISQAQNALNEAARQHGKKTVSINGESFGAAIDFGGEEGKCTDFMSPSDCNIMFNICDPVICPSSRCDLGGKYPVDNVVQTGIIGSLVLCLPNIKEGIAVPVCLTGIHAGIDGYISILNSTRECLNESLETGRNIGICDEIKSIYMCQFFWKQAAPFLNVIIPRLLETFYDQGARGGGEYLTVQGAWDNMQSSIDYFKNDYAVNSIEAFQARSTEEIGDEVCKSFMSVNYPTEGMFDQLIEPDSPVQYSAWFSEDIMTTATIPSTSHYKVYYHIFAGNDQGAQYVVYLKDLPETSYIASSGSYVVDRGYIGKSQSKDIARDFMAVSGYKQLCVSVNGQDNCGFGKVSTSYALNHLSDKYAEEQSQGEASTEKECVSGTPSLYSLAQPNLQAGVEDVIGGGGSDESGMFNSGIIRVCSTHNPGRSVDSSGEYDTTNLKTDRWKPVGHCGDPTIQCWLDTDSVKDIIKDRGLEQGVLDNVDVGIFGEIDYLTEKESETWLVEAQSRISEFAKEKKIDSNADEVFVLIRFKLETLIEKAPTNNLRARALFLLGNLWKTAAKSHDRKAVETISEQSAPAVDEIDALIDSIVDNANNPDDPEDPEDPDPIDDPNSDEILYTIDRNVIQKDGASTGIRRCGPTLYFDDKDVGFIEPVYGRIVFTTEFDSPHYEALIDLCIKDDKIIECNY